MNPPPQDPMLGYVAELTSGSVLNCTADVKHISVFFALFLFILNFLIYSKRLIKMRCSEVSLNWSKVVCREEEY